MPYKNRAKQLEFVKNYNKRRYKEDEDFRKRYIGYVCKSMKRAYAEGRTWNQKNPRLRKYFQKGYRAGMKMLEDYRKKQICSGCGKLRFHASHGLCGTCYGRKQRKKRVKEKWEGVEWSEYETRTIKRENT